MKATLPLAMTALILVGTTSVLAAEVEGFTEPSRDLDLAGADTGRIETVDVREGDIVRAGQTLATLNQDVLIASRRIVEKQLAAQGKMKSAQAELRLKTERVNKLRALLERRHATQEEVDRADIEREIAAAALEIVEEEQIVRAVEMDRIDHQLERHLIRSPIDGIVVRITKDVGEFVSPADPVVLRVVQLDPMLAVFNVPEQSIGGEFRAGTEVEVFVGQQAKKVRGVVDFVSPVIEPQSGTVRVKVSISNPDGSLYSGEKCLLITKDPVDQVAETPEETRRKPAAIGR